MTQPFPARRNRTHAPEHKRTDGNALERTADALLGIVAKEQAKDAFFIDSLDPDVGLEARPVVFNVGTLRHC
ncbi:MAG: hypothetical protein OEQ18_01170 [Gammaproteobacteria bacterium]|nr:hypothetical protein [Gammaproteobacteria bacterium]